MTGPPVVSIVVAALNEVASIRSCLEALGSQTYPHDQLEIIVSDGMSNDGTREIVLEMGARDPRIHLVDNVRRITPTAWNSGLLASHGSIVGIMSGHGEPRLDYVERCVDVLARHEASAVGGRIERTAGSIEQQAVAFVTSSPFGVGDAAHNYSLEPGPAETVFPGMWPRSVLERVGLFDEELVRNQDDELSFRIREAGLLIWYDPAIVVRYHPRGSAGALFRQYQQYATWKVRVYQKHPRAVRPRQLVPPAWVAVMTIGVVATPFVPWALGITGLTLGAYLAVMSIAVLRMPGRPVPAWRVLRAFLALHLGYGIGMWVGVVRFAPGWLGRRQGATPTRLPKIEEAGPKS